jgi:hemerythrin-like domain-containing protein/CBS domain-containing protein
MSSASQTLAMLLVQPLITIGGDVSVCQALKLARSKQVHHLPVVEGSALVGLVCTCDLHEASPDSSVGQWMSHPPVTLDASASTVTAAQTMKDRKVGSVIVTLEGQPRGIVTRGDLLAADPKGEDILVDCRCECCGLTRHLSTDQAGHTFCMYCKDPASATQRLSSALGAEAEVGVESMGALEMHPLASLISEHQLIGPLAEALIGFAAHIEAEVGSAAQADLERFARVFRDFADCVHHEKEEAILLPFLARHGFDWSEGPLAEIREEHHQERYLVDVLCQAATRKEDWNQEERRRVVATSVALASFQREHLVKENTQLFPAVMQRLGARELGRLEAEFRAFDAGIDRYMPRAELTTLARDLIRRYPVPGASARFLPV